jgi:hypothetical protein
MQPTPNWTEPTNRIKQTVVDGVPCYEFSILKTDQPLAWDVANNNYGPGGRLMNPPQVNRRAEMSFAAADPKFKFQGQYNVKAGMICTYGVRLRFKGGWPLNPGIQHDWKVYWQMHLPDDYQGAPSDGFHAISGHNGEITLARPNDPNGSYFFHTPEQQDTWDAHKYLMAIKWSKGADGFVKLADATTKRILAQYNGPTFPTGKFGASGEYMYGPLIGLYMDGVSLTADAIIYIAGFEGPLPDIWEGDKIADAAPVTPTPPTPPAPEPPAPQPPAPQPSPIGQQLVALLMKNRDQLTSQIDAMNMQLKVLQGQVTALQGQINLSTSMRDDINAQLDKGPP